MNGKSKVQNGKVPLENVPLERAVLGTMMSDSHFFWGMKDRARPELFTTDIHQKICKVIHALAEEGKQVNIPSIITRLGIDRENSDFSPEGYLATLLADEADITHAGHFLTDLEDIFARREMAKLGAELIRQSTADTGMDAAARLEEAKNSMEAIGDPVGSTVRHIAQIASAMMDRVADSAAKEMSVGLNSGLKQFQDLVGALMPGRVYTIAGPPGSGKSILGQQIAEYVADKDPALLVSIEMDDEEIAQRWMASDTGITTDRIERASLNNDEVDQLYDSIHARTKSKLYVDASSNVTVSKIRAKAMRMKRLKGLSLLVIDHLLYIDSPDRKLGEFAAIRANMQALKSLAKTMGIPVILLTQLKMSFGDGAWDQIRRPNVNDLYGGSSVEQESDVVIFVHREEYLLGRKKPSEDATDFGKWQDKFDSVKGKAELVLVKRRGGNGFGVRTLIFDGPRMRFYDQAPRKVNQPRYEDALL